MLTKADKYLIDDIHNILENGFWDEDPRPRYEDGTPAHTISVNHVTRKYDLSKGEFPVCTLRPQAWKTGVREIFTIYQKPTNVIAEMCEQGVTWWGPWDIGDGTIGQRYGATVKRYDLMNGLIKDIRENPYGRRKIVSLWQETDLRETPGLPPCAFLTIWNVRGTYLDMVLVQRSGDMLTASGAGGINEIQYAALLLMIARVTGKEPGVFTHFVANEQIYDRHIDNANEMLRRAAEVEAADGAEAVEAATANDTDAAADNAALPRLVLHKEPGCDFTDITLADFEMVNYAPIKPQLKFDLGI
ncbi:MAG: thymidylate synthase [Mogibacterium sp.]|nr:thymidylate synthase [Mogibacterium sp.]